MKKCVSFLLLFVVVMALPLSAFAASGLLPSGHFPFDIPSFEFTMDSEWNLRNLQKTGESSNGAVEIYQADCGNYSKLIFYVNADSGYVKSLMIANAASVLKSDANARTEHYRLTGMLTGVGLGWDEYDYGDADIFELMGFDESETDSFQYININFETKLGNVTYYSSADENLLTFAVTANPYTVQTDTPAQPKEQTIKLIVNGQTLHLDTAPKLVNERVLIPVRGVFEHLGANVSWQEETKTAVITKDNTEVKIVVDSSTAYVNGETKELDVPATVYDYRTFAPLRFVSEAINANVDWDQDTFTVTITTK